MKEIKIKKRTLRGDDGYQYVSFRMKVELVERLEEIAKQTERSRNDVVVTLLEAALENVVIEE